MADVNEVRISGTVKREAEERTIREGLGVIDFTLVVTDEMGGRPVFVDCVAYGDVASDDLGGYVVEGEHMTVCGRLTFRTFTDPNGVRHSGLVIHVTEIEEVSIVD